ncbi:alpha/beta hydrolase [Massilia aurea]|uniref:alpha/beta fold hydrolase n=1 Tax=Massilia aurea TaxID=373040 RepID=UPI0034633D15
MTKLAASLRTIAIAAAIVTGTAHAASPAAPAPAATSVVIVHGAFADGSDWAKVIPMLQAKGVKVTAIQNPLTSLKDDAAVARRVLDAQSGKVVLVGHSWGGTVITEAGAHDKVAALVYVAAFAPDAGQASGELGKGYTPSPGIGKLVADSEGFLTLPPEAMRDDFAQDLPAAQTAVMSATQGPIKGSAFGDKASNAAWKVKPSWYIVSTKDRMIDPQLQRAMAKKIGAHTTELPSSHVPQQSRPADVAKVILEAVAASKG